MYFTHKQVLVPDNTKDTGFLADDLWFSNAVFANNHIFFDCLGVTPKHLWKLEIFSVALRYSIYYICTSVQVYLIKSRTCHLMNREKKGFPVFLRQSDTKR